MPSICLVSCVSKKRPDPSPAADLYVSQWFVAARAYAERHADHWFILSAEHGLLDPKAVTGPYEKTLNYMPINERRAWSLRVQAQMAIDLPNADRCTVLAGSRYREFLLAYLERRYTVDVPMAGLTIGRQLQWLGQQATGARASAP